MEKIEELADIVYTLGSYDGHPITDILTVEEQKEILKAGFTVSDIIDTYISAYQDWQCDC
jgi:hypothetical protein